MRTTLDIPEPEHTLFTSLARQQSTSFSKLIVEMALRGLKAPPAVADAPETYRIDPATGLGVFRTGHPLTIDGVKALDDEW